MHILKELPPGTIWPHLVDAIQQSASRELAQLAQSRTNDVRRGAESPELAALLVEKFADGMIKAFEVVGIDCPLREEADRLVRLVDPEFEANRAKRWAARPATIQA